MKNTDSEYLNQFFENAKLWQKEMLLLRKICLSTPLAEEKKWWQPTYTYNGKNVCIIGHFKEFCTLSFFKGSLVRDEQNMLVFPGPNSRMAKLFKFTSLDDIQKKQHLIKDYILQAIELEKKGIKVPQTSNQELVFPTELEEFLDQDEAYKIAFEKLTPGRQKAYILLINSAKQSETKINRIKKFRSKVIEGKGPNEY